MPDIENPTTYAEWWWNTSIESRIAEQERYEKELAPITSGVIGGLNIEEFLPESLTGLFSALQAPTAPALGSVLARFASEVADGVVGQTLNHALQDFNYKMAEWFSDLRIDFPTASLLLMRKKITEELFNARAKSAGYKEAEAAAGYDALRPFPTIPEIIQWARYTGDYNNPKEQVWKKFDVDVNDYELWDFLSATRLSTEQAQQLYIRGKLTEFDFLAEIARIGYFQVDRDGVKDLAYAIPNAMLLTQGNLVSNQGDDIVRQDIQRAGIHPDYTQKYLDGILTKPNSIDVVTYALRKDPNLSNLPNELQRIGIHPDYHDLYRELAYPIPPITDIITMAVREAFTPSIAQRFGQYEDLPPVYVEWAQKKGLTKDWAERYWAAHWALPSVQQGFEMLHRKIIDRPTLELLLRALDIMPFWRDKLIQMSYTPLTRVDVRRMYAVGTLDENGVKKAYQDIGYNDANAELMKDFTVRYVRRQLSGFSSRDVITAYVNRFIDEGEFRTIQRDIGTKDTEINNILQSANRKREWKYKTERIDAIENLYKKGRITEATARNELDDLGLPSDHIQTLIQQWQAKVIELKEGLWTTAQTLSFLKKGLIDAARAAQELTLLGYSQERIQVYIRSTQG